jgi:hypothetical protein
VRRHGRLVNTAVHGQIASTWSEQSVRGGGVSDSAAFQAWSSALDSETLPIRKTRKLDRIMT